MATFGQSTTGVASTPDSNDRYWGCAFVLSVTGVVSKVSAAFGFDGGSPNNAGDNGKAVIYKNDGTAGAPGTRMGISSAVAIPGGNQAQVDFPLSVTLAPGTYYLGIVTDGFNSRINKFSASGGTRTLVDPSNMSYASPPNPCGTPTSSGTEILTVWATYTIPGFPLMGQILT